MLNPVIIKNKEAPFLQSREGWGFLLSGREKVLQNLLNVNF